MGLVEAFLENASFKAVFLIAVAFYTIYYIGCRIDEHIRIRRLGRYGPYLRTYAPWGERISLHVYLS